MERYTRVYAKIDLDAAEWNMREMRANLTEGAGIIAVVKTDGYGHGAAPIAKAVDPYAAGYAVATVEEARNLQCHGITKPVLILGAVHPGCSRELVRYGIRPSVFTLRQAEALSEAARALGKTAEFHLAVDTGMSRIGVSCDAAGADLAARIAGLPGLHLEGVFTHFAQADEADKTPARRQLGRYREFLAMLAARGISVPIRHISNSAGILELPEAHFDMVRAGISLYGLYPSDEAARDRVRLRPVLSLRSFVTYVKEIPEGAKVSYGGTFTAKHPMRIATIPVGYGDGYPRNLSGKGCVLIRGKRAPILGRVCMDQFMADVTDIPGVQEDDPVTLIGEDGGERIPVEELAETGGGFHYEIVCDIGKRVPRVYVRGGQVLGTKDYFNDVYEDFL